MITIQHENEGEAMNAINARFTLYKIWQLKQDVKGCIELDPVEAQAAMLGCVLDALNEIKDFTG